MPRVDVPLRRTEIAFAPRGKRSRYLRAADTSYGEHGRHNLLDVWARSDLAPDARAPLLLQIPGGAWVTGRKTGQAYPLLSHLAERGWVGVSISHRLSPKARWPAHIVDVKRAVAWVKQHIARYGGDPSFVAITGGSSGGHLSALAALTPGVREFQPGFEDVDTTVQAAVPMYGVYDLVDDYKTRCRRAARASRANGVHEQARRRPEIVAAGVAAVRLAERRAVVLRDPRPQRRLHARRASAALRRGPPQGVVAAGCVRRAAVRSACVRRVGLDRAHRHTVRAIERFLDVCYCNART
jgi:acetyl esterase/lipase